MRIWKEKVGKSYVHFADFTCAKVRYRPQAATKEELDEIIAAIRLKARAKKFGLVHEQESIGIGELVEERKKDFNLQDRNQRHALSVLQFFAQTLGEGRAIHTITTADVRAFVQALRAKNPKLHPTSINNYLNKVNSMLHKAGEFFPGLETWKVPKMPFSPEGDKGRERLIAEEEQALIFFQLRAPRAVVGVKHRRREKESEVRSRHTVADIFDLALLTGMRNGEVRMLAWTKIDWTIKRFGEQIAHGFIRLPPPFTKTKEPRLIPLNNAARDLLERRRAENGDCAWIFPNQAKTWFISETVLRRTLHRAAKKAGIIYGRIHEDGFTFHDGRHTAATNMLEGGAHIKTVGSILGHTDETMTMRYSHATAEARAGAVSALAKRGQIGNKLDKKLSEEEEESDK